MSQTRSVRYGIAGVVGVSFLVVSLAALTWSVRFQDLAARAQMSRQLAAIGDDLVVAINEEISRLSNEAPFSTASELSKLARFRWRVTGRQIPITITEDPLDVALAAALRDLPRSGASISGPVTTVDGVDLLILNGTTGGIAVPVVDVMVTGGIIRLVQAGNRVDLAWSERPLEFLFSSHVHTMRAPVVVKLRSANAHWKIRAEPVQGWIGFDAVWPLAVVCFLLAFLVGAIYLLMARKPDELAAETALLTQRLSQTQEDLETSVERRAQVENRLRTATTLDVESGLANRAAFEIWLSDQLQLLRDQVGVGLTVVVLRLGNLPRVATVVGANAFFLRLDEYLTDFQNGHHPRPFCARLSDRELAFCIPDQAASDAVTNIASDLCRRFGAEFDIGGEVIDLGPAVGLAVAPDGYQYAEELIQGAMLAAIEADARTGNKWLTYDPQTRERQTSLLQLESQIGEAISENQFRLFCQPIVHTGDGALAGFETLLRWQHPVEGLLAPGRFIDVAVASRHMPRLSQWCVNETISLADRWVSLRAAPFYLSVNLMASDFVRPGFVNRLLESVEHAELPSDRLRIEVTEREIIKDLGTTARATAMLEDHGLHVLLDDFGTGFSSLTHLRVFQFHTVKIDRSFISTMRNEPKDLALVKAVIDLVHDLGMQCVAEGVETQEELDLLRTIGCDYCQGYFFSRPVPPEEVPEVVARFPSPMVEAHA